MTNTSSSASRILGAHKNDLPSISPAWHFRKDNNSLRVTLALIYIPQLIGNNSWELFLGAFRKIPGNYAKKSLGTKIYWCGPKLRKGEVPGSSWEQNLLMWSKIRVCAMFPGTFPGTKCPSSWESSTFFHKRHDWAEAILGTKPDKQILFGCLGFLVLPLWRCFVLPRREGRQLQPQSSGLHNSCENHPAIMQVSEEDKRATTNVQNGLVFLFLFSFILFSYLWTKTAVKPLNSKKKSWRKNSEKLWKSVRMCGKLPKSAKKCRADFAL